MPQNSDEFRPGLFVRDRYRRRRHRDESAVRNPGALVRVMVVTILVALWIAIILSCVKGNDEDSLSGYWISLTPEQQDATCETYKSYPDFASNSMAGLLHHQVTSEQARIFLWGNCG